MAEKGPVLRYMDQGSSAGSARQVPATTPRDISAIPITPDETTGVANPEPAHVPLSIPGTMQTVPVTTSPVEYRTFDFTYRSDKYSAKIPVNMSLYSEAETQWGNAPAPADNELESCYTTLVNSPLTALFVNDTAREISSLRYKGGNILTDDEYLEMITSFVQQIPCTNSSLAPRHPIALMYDTNGDCDEKAVLLTGILAREGYDTALLIFPQERRVAAGLRIHLATNNPSFRVFSNGKQDYLYVEPMTTRLVGIYPEEYGTIAEPVVVPVGNGHLLYTKTGDVTSILFDVRTLRTNIRLLEKKAKDSGGALNDEDMETLSSYINTYNFVLSTNDRVAAIEAISESELPHHTYCMTCS